MTFLPPELAAKHDRLLESIRGYGRCAVAFSGGVDRAVVAEAAQLACGTVAVAVTAVSDSLGGQVEEAREVARLIGIRHVELPTRENSTIRVMSKTHGSLLSLQDRTVHAAARTLRAAGRRCDLERGESR